MKPPKRLLDEGASDFERAVLRSGLDEPPPDRLLESTLAAVGVTGALAATAGTAQAAAAAAAGGGKGASASWIWFLVKCLGVGAGAGVVAVGAVEVASPPPPSPAQSGVQRTVVSAVVAAQPPRASEAPPPPEEASPAPEPPAAEAPLPRPMAGASASAPKSTSTLAAEIALVDPARKALNAGDPNRALTLLDQHAKEFPGGVLAQEAEILRIHALFARGDRAAAAERAKRFLARNPQSPHAERLRRIADPSGDVAKP